jgi:tRNA-2-methylthio-N6-dimethylallyladenosine synthase
MSDPRSPLPKVHVKTYGCQMNELDSAKMIRLLELDGWAVTDEPGGADALVINTCTVREKPTHKAVSLLGVYRQLKQRKPDLRIVVTGCYAVQEGVKMLRRHREVDAVVGPDAVARIDAVLRRTSRERFVDLAGEDAGFAPEPVFRGSRRIAAFVAIQRGCDHRCAYCIVPSVRGRERYRASEDVVAEVEALLASGARDITLLGQNVNRYRGRSGAGVVTRFPALLRQVAALDPTMRVRFLTSNPWDLSGDLVDVLGEVGNVCPYLHLPVQSGSDAVLERMRRPHTAAQYLDLVARIRDARPDAALSSDILLGFPGETEADYQATADLVQRVGFAHLYVFAYSPRPGTVSADWDDDVPAEVKRARVNEVLRLQMEQTAAVLASHVGQRRMVLVDGVAGEDLIGRTPDYTLVHLRGPRAWMGREIPVRIDEAMKHTLRGTAEVS